MGPSYLPLSGLLDDRAEVVTTRRDPDLAKLEIHYTFGPNPDSVPVSTLAGSSKVLGHTKSWLTV